MARNTRTLQLRHVGAFYEFCDQRFGADALDIAISKRDAERLQQMVEGFHTHLTSDPDFTTTAAQRWDAVRGFAGFTALRLAPGSAAWRALLGLLSGMGSIRPPKRERIRFMRALPAKTLDDLLVVAEPGSLRNPFKAEAVELR